MKHSQGFLALVDEARAHIRETDCPTVQARLQAGESPVIIDVRETEEWNQGHVPGAVHLSKGIIERDVETRFPDKSAELILYCGGGYRSALASWNLQKMGYTGVVSMDGGWRGWTENGYPVAQG